MEKSGDGVLSEVANSKSPPVGETF
jgi:hypothetical protein